MQGLQILCSNNDAWTAFAAQYVDRLRDEYGKAGLVFAGINEDITSLPRVCGFEP